MIANRWFIPAKNTEKYKNNAFLFKKKYFCTKKVELFIDYLELYENCFY